MTRTIVNQLGCCPFKTEYTNANVLIHMLRPNVPTYATPLKYVLFWWRKACTFEYVVEEQAWDILSRHTHVFNGQLCRTCYTHPVTVNWPVNHFVTVNILHISFHLTSYRIREKRSSSLICQSQVFHAENSAHIFCIMMHLKVNDQMDV